MKSHDFLNENIVDDAAIMHQDHEVQMARKECYHSAENAIKIHQLLQQISETQGLEGWVAAKITLASDYLTTVREYLEYQAISGQQPVIAEASNLWMHSDVQELRKAFADARLPINDWTDEDLELYIKDGGVDRTIWEILSIMGRYDNILGPYTKGRGQAVLNTISKKGMSQKGQDFNYKPDDWSQDFEHRMKQGMSEAYEEYDDIDDDDEEQNDGFYVVIASEDSGVFVGALTKDGGRWRETTVKGKAPHNWGGGYMSYLTPDEVMRWIHKDYDRSYEVAGPFYDDQDVEDYANSLMETSAGSVAGVVNANGMGKKKSQIGSLFGGTYNPKKAKK